MQVYEERFFQMYFRIFDEVYYMYTASVCSTVTISGKETSYRTASTYVGYGFPVSGCEMLHFLPTFCSTHPQ